MDSFFTIPGHNYQSTNSSIKTDFSVSDFERANVFFSPHTNTLQQQNYLFYFQLVTDEYALARVPPTDIYLP